MFLDLLDTIKTSENHKTPGECKMNAAIGESMLYYLMLSGEKPILNQTQLMDSSIIHNILRDEKNKKHFLKIIKNGNIKLSLYTGNGARSLQDYFKKSLTYGIDNETDFFDFSIMPFLKEYDLNVRRNLNKNIISAIEDNSYNFKSDGVKAEHSDYIADIVDGIQDIDKTIRGEYLVGNTYKKNIDDLFKKQCMGIINDENINSEFLEHCQRMLGKTDYKNRRSIYYKYIENMKSDYSNESTEKIRQIVDNCYNEASASLINNNGYSLNFSSNFIDLIKPVQINGNVEEKKIIQFKSSDDDKYLTWEILTDIMEEVESIKNEKKLSQIEALKEYKKKQYLKPIISVSKYVGVTAMGSVIPAIPGVFEIISNVFLDGVGEKMRKPSLEEMSGEVKNMRKNIKVVEKTIEFISMSMK